VRIVKLDREQAGPEHRDLERKTCNAAVGESLTTRRYGQADEPTP
jgi:hypothetical protein